MRKGDIYLVDFGKSRDSFEFGKKRPVIVFQTDKLNFAIEEGIYDYCLVIPLSTKNDIVTDDFRLLLPPREDLKQESYVVVNSFCFLHKKHFHTFLGRLSDVEIKKIEEIVLHLFDIETE